MHGQPPPAPTAQPDSMHFEFKHGIPSAHAAGLLKFGLEALPGVQRMGFIGDREIHVLIDAVAVEMERVWEVIAAAGFATADVALRGGLLAFNPVDMDAATPSPSRAVAEGESVAA